MVKNRKLSNWSRANDLADDQRQSLKFRHFQGLNNSASLNFRHENGIRKCALNSRENASFQPLFMKALKMKIILTVCSSDLHKAIAECSKWVRSNGSDSSKVPFQLLSVELLLGYSRAGCNWFWFAILSPLDTVLPMKFTGIHRNSHFEEHPTTWYNTEPFVSYTNWPFATKERIGSDWNFRDWNFESESEK